jgi:hypothetical protein
MRFGSVRVSDANRKRVGELWVRFSGSRGQMLCCKGSVEPAGNGTVLCGIKIRNN